MDTEFAISIIDQIGTIQAPSLVAFHGAGESLLHRDIKKILGATRKYPAIEPGLLTNGGLLERKKSQEIIDSGIKWIGFSLDGINKAKFEKYRIGADYETILANVLDFIELKEKNGAPVNVRVNMTMQEEMKDEVNNFLRFWLDKVDEVSISPCRPIGSRKSILIPKGTKRIPCHMVYDVMVIFWDGRVPLCCEDWFCDVLIGNLQEVDLLNVWNNINIYKIRMLHENGSYESLSLCRDCGSWYNPVSVTFYDEKLNCEVSKNAWQITYRKKKTL